MRFLDPESLRVVLLDAKQHLIKIATVSQGTVNESLAHPREIFKPVNTHSAYSFIMVPSGDPSPSEADLRLTRRIDEASSVLQLNLLDHVIIGSPAPSRNSYFSFKEGGVFPDTFLTFSRLPSPDNKLFEIQPKFRFSEFALPPTPRLRRTGWARTNASK